MSQPDLLTQIRGSRPTAPPELRQRVRLIAAQAPRRERRLTWRRGLLVAVPALAAVVVAAIVLPRHANDNNVTAAQTYVRSGTATPGHGFDAQTKGAPSAGGGATRALAPITTPSRVQRYSGSMELRVKDVSDATKSAQRIASSLGGFTARVDVSARGRIGDAELVLRVPREHVGEATTRIAALGTILAENVSIQDLTAELNATDREMARLQQQLHDLRAQQPQTDATRRLIDQLTQRIQNLQRQSAATTREAHFATLDVTLTTRKAAVAHHNGHGPLHGLAVAFRWIGIGAVYALALGAPLAVLLTLVWLAARAVRRRREDALLSSP